MYHERQSRQMCLVHALNALFQKPQFTSESLDEICYSLNESRWFNPHRSMLGLGNYDANVLMSALAMHDYQIVWFDGRLPVERIRFDNVDALIVNIPTKNYIPFWKGRHWYTILRQTDGKFYNLDSKLDKPVEITDIVGYCRNLLAKTADANQIFLVGKDDPSGYVSTE
ncbi:Josephin domain-containing protein [Trichostrongylus colubriformis]|uniref:ubiquitinyl hydrolase 1 n=1 Tax=Trichostrongylus colubriformis TaxID=6319 RepID=A0AAN8G3W9_TRICO